MPIRMANPADVPAILDIYAPYVLTTAATFEYDVPSLEEFTQRFHTITAQFPWLVWEQDGQILGYAYASAPFKRAAYQWCAESSVYLAPSAQGKGIGKRLCAALEQILQRQGYCKLYAIITTQNESSLAFHRAIGYTETAQLPGCGFKFGNWYGITWMEKQLNPGEFTQNTPTPVETIVENDRNFLEVLAKMSLF